MIGYNLKLPKQKDFRKVLCNKGLNPKDIIVYKDKYYEVKRLYMIREAGHIVETIPASPSKDAILITDWIR